MEKELYYAAQRLIGDINSLSETASSIKEIINSCKKAEEVNNIRLYVSNSSCNNKVLIGVEAAELALEYEIERCNENILKKRILLERIAEQALVRLQN